MTDWSITYAEKTVQAFINIRTKHYAGNNEAFDIVCGFVIIVIITNYYYCYIRCNHNSFSYVM